MEPQPHSCVIRGPTIRLPPPLPQDGDTGRQHFVFNPFKHRHSKKMSVEVRNGERIINSFPFNSFCFAEKLTESTFTVKVTKS